MYQVFAIQPLAEAVLFAPGTIVDSLFAFTGRSAKDYTTDRYFNKRAGAFKSNYFKAELEQRGLINSRIGPELKHFPSSKTPRSFVMRSRSLPPPSSIRTTRTTPPSLMTTSCKPGRQRQTDRPKRSTFQPTSPPSKYWWTSSHTSPTSALSRTIQSTPTSWAGSPPPYLSTQPPSTKSHQPPRARTPTSPASSRRYDTVSVSST